MQREIIKLENEYNKLLRHHGMNTIDDLHVLKQAMKSAVEADVSLLFPMLQRFERTKNLTKAVLLEMGVDTWDILLDIVVVLSIQDLDDNEEVDIPAIRAEWTARFTKEYQVLVSDVVCALRGLEFDKKSLMNTIQRHQNFVDTLRSEIETHENNDSLVYWGGKVIGLLDANTSLRFGFETEGLQDQLTKTRQNAYKDYPAVLSGVYRCFVLLQGSEWQNFNTLMVATVQYLGFSLRNFLGYEKQTAHQIAVAIDCEAIQSFEFSPRQKEVLLRWSSHYNSIWDGTNMYLTMAYLRNLLSGADTIPTLYNQGGGIKNGIY